MIQKKGLINAGFSLTTPYNNMADTIEPSKKTITTKTSAMFSPKAAMRYTTVNRRHPTCDSKRDRKAVISTRTSMDSVGKTHQVHRSNEYRD